MKETQMLKGKHEKPSKTYVKYQSTSKTTFKFWKWTSNLFG
jgi:hypothetical protein